MTTLGSMGRIAAMALTGATLLAGTAVSFTFSGGDGDETRGVRSPCGRSAAHGIIVHVKHHVRRCVRRA